MKNTYILLSVTPNTQTVRAKIVRDMLKSQET